jgi:hypothetical protein
MIARQKDSGFGWKLEDFEFRAAFTIVQQKTLQTRLKILSLIKPREKNVQTV